MCTKSVTVEKLPEAIAAGRSVKISKGDTSLEVFGKDDLQKSDGA